MDLLADPSAADYNVKPSRYIKIDLGNSELQDSPDLSTVWSSITSLLLDADGNSPDNLDPRKLHHISAIVLAVLGYEGRTGVVDVYNTLRADPDLLDRMIDEELTAVKSYEQDSEEKDTADPSHGNFERILILNQAFAKDFGASFMKVDNSGQGVENASGGANRVANSLLNDSAVRDAVIDLGFITARKLADAILVGSTSNPENVGYTNSIFGKNEGSIAINLTVLNEARPNDTFVQKERLTQTYRNLKDAIIDVLPSGFLGIFSSTAQTDFGTIFDLATAPGADAKIVLGSIQGPGGGTAATDYRLQSGFGILIGGSLADSLTGHDKRDFLFSPSGDGDILDGGKGNDVVIAVQGKNATTIGGLGRDVIINKTKGGVIWGDIENSFRRADGTRGYVASEVNARGEMVAAVKTVADTAANADTFWFAPGTTIMDAQKNDRLKFYGITLTGGDSVRARASGGCVSAVAASSVVSFAMPGIAAADLPLIYFDRFVPWIKYKLGDGAAAGTKDLIIGNVLDSFLTLLGAGSVGAQGNMRVTDYKRGAGVIFSERGDLGLAFEGISISGILAALAALAANDNERGIERLIRRYV